MQLYVLALSLSLMGFVSLFFISAVLASRSVDASGSESVSPSPEVRRKKYIWAMFFIGIIVTFASLWRYPHTISNSTQAQAINVTGAQWYWEIDKEEVLLNKPVVFNVHTTDVNHGMGVLNSDGKLMFQTQAMPGYVNKVEHVFTKPGEYKVICLEFCGVSHHDMITEFQVVAKKENKND
ncbi:MAG: hypothetical protein DHS20C07_00240 [Methyloligella sp.]|nr:MAG: hypothetical protein DHS20C07_00240 [Methyloligella sp.]